MKSRLKRIIFHETPLSVIHFNVHFKGGVESRVCFGGLRAEKASCVRYRNFPPKARKVRGSGKAQTDPESVAWIHSKSICSIESIGFPTDWIDLTGRLVVCRLSAVFTTVSPIMLRTIYSIHVHFLSNYTNYVIIHPSLIPSIWIRHDYTCFRRRPAYSSTSALTPCLTSQMQNRNIFREVFQDYIGKQDSCESRNAMREDGFTELQTVLMVPQLENHSIMDSWIN